MTLQELSERSGVSENAILHNLLRIEGARLVDGVLSFSENTRYPCKKGLRIKDPVDKYFAVLYAIGNEKHIDQNYLMVPTDMFMGILEDLERVEYICPIVEGKHNGANGYRITLYGAEKLKENKREVLKDLALLAGTFTGAAIAAM